MHKSSQTDTHAQKFSTVIFLSFLNDQTQGYILFRKIDNFWIWKEKVSIPNKFTSNSISHPPRITSTSFCETCKGTNLEGEKYVVILVSFCVVLAVWPNLPLEREPLTTFASSLESLGPFGPSRWLRTAFSSLLLRSVRRFPERQNSSGYPFANRRGLKRHKIEQISTWQVNHVYKWWY